jgi:hypothetical protein
VAKGFAIIRIWFAYTWRCVLASLPILWFIRWLASVYPGVPDQPNVPMMIALPIILLIYMGVALYLVRYIVNQSYGRYRLSARQPDADIEKPFDWALGFRFWWAYLWRILLIGGLFGTAMEKFTSLPRSDIDLAMTLASPIIGILVMAWLVNKSYGHVRLQLVSLQPVTT